MSPEDRAAWIERLGIVGRAQARYLWLLLITGTFYLAVHVRVASPAMPSDELILPVVNLPLNAVPVWATGPIVLSILLLAIHGSLRAFKTAAAALGVEGLGGGEEYDVAPNALDFVVYTTSESPACTRSILLFTYPLYLSIFCAEAWWLLVSVYARSGVPFKGLFVVLGATVTVLATWRVRGYVIKNGKRALAVMRGEKVV